MISTYKDMFAIRAIALLCLISVSHSGPLDCKDVVKPLDQVDPLHFEGRWALVAESLKIIEGEASEPSTSISIDFRNSTYTQANRFGDVCYYFTENITLEGSTYKVGQVFNLSGTFYQTSCEDCAVFSFSRDFPNSKTEELLLFSKRREVDQKELTEFITQVECLNMPVHFVMDPTAGLCPVLPRHLARVGSKNVIKV